MKDVKIVNMFTLIFKTFKLITYVRTLCSNVRDMFILFRVSRLVLSFGVLLKFDSYWLSFRKWRIFTHSMTVVKCIGFIYKKKGSLSIISLVTLWFFISGHRFRDPRKSLFKFEVKMQGKGLNRLILNTLFKPGYGQNILFKIILQ